MERKDFLKNTIGLVGATALLHACKKTVDTSAVTTTTATTTTTGTTSGCTVSPTETAGPYPLPSTVTTSPLYRTDITESTQTSVPLSLTLSLVNTNSNCAAISGARVDIWQCNKRGYYSAYANQPGVDGTLSYVGSTWLRGIQLSDTSGQVKFTTIYPGWYSGRATHIHVEVFINSVLKATTQIAFPDALNTTLNAYYGLGVNPTTNSNDNVFSDSYASEMISISGSTSAGYAGSYTVGVAL